MSAASSSCSLRLHDVGYPLHTQSVKEHTINATHYLGFFLNDIRHTILTHSVAEGLVHDIFDLTLSERLLDTP